MSNYTITTDFGAKDDLPSGNAAKVIKGSEFSDEFTNIKTAVNSKADSVSPTFTGNTALNGTTTFGPDGTSTFNGTVNFTKDVTFDTNTMFVDVSENKVGIGNVAPATALDVTGVITTDGLTSSAGIDVTGNVSLDDDGKALFGASNDLQIFHTGSYSAIRDVGTGGLFIGGENYVDIGNAGATSTYARFHKDAQVDLYHNNSVKLSTTSTGIDVTGTVTADNLTVDGGGVFQGTSTQIDLIETDVTGNNTRLRQTVGDFFIQTVDNSSANPVSRFSLDHATGDISFYEDTGTTPKLTWDSSAEQFIAKDGAFFKVTETDSSTVAAQLKSDADEGLLQLYYGGTEKVRVRTNADSYFNGGNVGIGTTSPDTLLEVVGADPILTVRDTSTDYANSHATLRLAESGSGDTLNQYYDVALNEGNLTIGDHTSEYMRISSTGNVGIGTNSPSDKFHVANGSTGAGYLRIANNEGYARLGTDGGNLLLDVGGSEKARIDSSGNVGIGTTSPSHKFHVSGSNSAARFSDDGTGFSLDIEHDTANGITTLQQTNSGGDLRLQGGSASGLLLFETSGSERMRIDASGNVGIGTTSPSSALDVNGTVTATAFAGDGSNLTGVLSDLVDDTTPQLGGALDANDKEIQNVNQIGIGFSGNVNYNIQVEDTKPLTNVEMVRIKNTSNTFGRVMTFYKSSNHHGSIGLSSVNMGQGVFVSSQQGGLKFQNQFSTVVVEPCGGDGSDRDNSVDLGRSSNRFDDIYATNSTIQTSDRNLKQDVESLTDAEQRVAVAAKGLLRKFRWIDAVEEKGDDARIHFGIMAQDLRDAFTAEGLDAGRYAMFTSTTWWEHEGENYYEADHAPEGATEVTRLGVRYSELLAFIISAI